jgi:crotonobetainyl-CoA:carnitine CoA-transferase CaiB-like acyl-CoA transferase
VLSLEQATALPYATLRFVHLGWRVIRVEATGDDEPGDPNRYVGRPAIDASRRATFLAPNVGKETIGLNLKAPEGRALLKRLIGALSVDIFCCNILPRRYRPLGVDYETLATAKSDLIWAGISALGPDYPETGGYDPMIQAMSGLMDINGFADNPPTLIGLPLTDLKAGDELYASVLLALAEQAESGGGKRIDVSMLQAAMSWLISVLPLVDLGAEPAALTRTGNAHRQFVPANVYPASDGFIYLAFSSNRQWQSFVSIDGFAALDVDAYRTFDQRVEQKTDLYRDIAGVTSNFTVAELGRQFMAAGLPCSAINDVPGAMQLDAIAAKLTSTTLPDGRTIRLPPPAVDTARGSRHYDVAPRFGEQTDAVLAEAGLTTGEISTLRACGVVA